MTIQIFERTVITVFKYIVYKILFFDHFVEMDYWVLHVVIVLDQKSTR